MNRHIDINGERRSACQSQSILTYGSQSAFGEGSEMWAWEGGQITFVFCSIYFYIISFEKLVQKVKYMGWRDEFHFEGVSN